MRRPSLALLLTVILSLLWASPAAADPLASRPAQSASDLIATVNGLRAARGLPAYSVDSGLMTHAQTHADYMASTGVLSHVRPDGSVPWDSGIQEDIAMGTGLTPDTAVYSTWTDALHWNIMIYASGTVGAGVSFAGNYTYFVLNVRKGGGSSVANVKPAAQALTPVPIESLVTATPLEDGSIIHTVGYGQTLISIAQAYGVKVSDIRELNGMAATISAIYEGQKLVIRKAQPATETPTVTATAPRPTRTLTPTRAPRTATPTRTATLSPTPTPRSVLNQVRAALPDDRRSLGLTLIVLCAIGLVAVLGFGFLRKN